MPRCPMAMARVLAGLPAAVLLALHPGGLQAETRALSFAERVTAEERIERLYHAHRGDARPFEDAVPPEVIEARVRTYLFESAALERIWNTPVTAAALRREMKRIAANTLFPGRLEEIYAALDHDPFLVQETFVRRSLVDRLTRSFFAYDARLHADARAGAEDARRWMARGRLPFDRSDAHWAEIELVSRDRDDGAERPGRDGPERLVLGRDEYARRLAMVPAGVGDVGPVVEHRDRFSVEVLLAREDGRLRLGAYSVRKRAWDEWRAEASVELEGSPVVAVADADVMLPAPRSAETEEICPMPDRWSNGILDDIPEPRFGHTAVWTGSEMIVWGGTGTLPYLDTGGRYDPLTDVWTPTSRVNAPSGRELHTAIWTGAEMIIWGGTNGSSLDTGGRYLPAVDTWLPLSVAGAPSPRFEHTAVWTGLEMIVWGGEDGGVALNTGARYRPDAGAWEPTSLSAVPLGKNGHTAVWTGSEMIVWGGNSGSSAGGRYRPDTDSWAPVTTVGAPITRTSHTAVWTGTEMVVWGGSLLVDLVDTGGRYNPSTDSWLPTRRTGAPTPRRDHTAVWTGTKMIVWGGLGGTNVNTGGHYDPFTDSWIPTGTLGAVPAARTLHSAVWTGDRMVVWGGAQDGELNTSGGRYDPAAGLWTPTATTNGQRGRKDHSSIWTGTEVIVWGGFDTPQPVYLDSGSRYDPLADSWAEMSTTGAPAGRELHHAAWTGSEMLVWGGFDGVSYLDSGGRYDPISDQWQPLSPVNAPSPRQGATSVWTGDEWILWGGFQDGSYLRDGRRYDPATDTWTSTSLVGAPLQRSFHTAVWTGMEMIVWGGSWSLDVLANGGRYDPKADHWTPVSGIGAPAPRSQHSAVWTGERMLVWSGFDGVTRFRDGGIYDPASDGWEAMSTLDAPSGRVEHTAVWDGAEMIIWGGSGGSGAPFLDSGGHFQPSANAWAPTDRTEAPSPRTDHSAVWTGTFMVVWGGSDGSVLNTGGRYLPEVREPGIVSDVRFTDSSTLRWAAASGPALQHDVLRGPLFALPVGDGSEICLASLAGTSTVDDTVPPVGSGLWYLVRGVNGCGAGSYGVDFDGVERLSAACDGS